MGRKIVGSKERMEGGEEGDKELMKSGGGRKKQGNKQK